MLTPKVFIVDEDETVRLYLCELFQSVELEVELFNCGQDFLQSYEQSYDPSQLSCVLLDTELPDMDGLDLQLKLQRRQPDLPVVVISANGSVTRAIQAMKNGAKDFFEKPVKDQLLLDCVQQILIEDRSRYAALKQRQMIARSFNTLSPREQEIMERVVQGMSNKLIALDLSISHKTVEVHRSKVMEKMRAKSLAELIQHAITLEMLE